jgi:probable rRNA maturation factor
MRVVFFGVKGFSIKRKIKKSFAQILKDLKIENKNLTVNVGYVSESTIQKLNAQHRGADKITDVLTFPLLSLEVGTFITESMYQAEKHPQTNLLEIGDIIICEAVAQQQAKKYGHSFMREVVFLATHGFLHILGFDHQTKDEEELMNDFCEKNLKKIGVNR